MKALFQDLMAVDDVKGVLYMSMDGKVLFSQFSQPPPAAISANTWKTLMRSLAGVQEVELTYENCRLFLRRTQNGFLLVFTGTFALSAMVRLNCDIIVPSLNSIKKRSRGLARARIKRGNVD